MADYCCDQMQEDLERRCAVHEDRSDCPDAFIGRASGGYGLLIHDGGSSMIAISFCPWCGTRLPERD
ncbi:DUF6980 family protein [Sphingomonas panni]|uniref:DUF6980 family protein n=1 Tax=Sphingomonas panni TaxID=237612 RepID=UPI001F5BFCFB|nr:hypothetical protein [Sphingomonas panni]